MHPFRKLSVESELFSLRYKKQKCIPDGAVETARIHSLPLSVQPTLSLSLSLSLAVFHPYISLPTPLPLDPTPS